MFRVIATAALAAFLAISATLAQARPSPECKELLNWLSKGLLETQQWMAGDAVKGAEELTAAMDVVRLQLWIAEVASYQKQMAYVTLPKIIEALNCVAAGAEPASLAPQSDAKEDVKDHLIPVCAPHFIRNDARWRAVCPLPWIEVWHRDYVGLYKQVWICPENGPGAAYGTAIGNIEPDSCSSAFVREETRRTVRASTGR